MFVFIPYTFTIALMLTKVNSLDMPKSQTPSLNRPRPGMLTTYRCSSKLLYVCRVTIR